MNQEQYEKDLKQRQKEHLSSINQGSSVGWQPCLHDGCSECIGTGIKKVGGYCVHGLACPCPKCSPSS